MKTFVIGDIHGGLKAIPQILKKAKVNTEDTLIFLGDYVDGWGESAQVIDFLIKLESTHKCIFIKGNHDVYCENWLKEGTSNQSWLFHGGTMTIKSYENYSSEQKSEHLNFLERMKLFHVDEQNRLFIHAGFTSMHGPYQEVHQSNYNWDRTLWEMALTMDKRIKKDSLLFPKRLKLFKEIYIGHTPTTHYNVMIPMQGCNVWNVDTGAAFKGHLSIMDIDSKKYCQSDSLHSLYPEEKGRN
ncbi:serine/threonine protein phosphatase [Tenacibaculum sp. E3R01]|uniref:metallophosphoesterase family protein n=1 Tax=Tenacibaculum sp. E3R01 TaxID=2267227 RepID=UPI000DE9DB82|nr:metallophosphoesterase family protein [Tenacibaculum sp. E3R01]RBW62405.1 serine/threonine protein phosphatase [Tenacibaculum sp. E3R01]